MILHDLNFYCPSTLAYLFSYQPVINYFFPSRSRRTAI